MSECYEYNVNGLLYLDNELIGEEADEFREHLKTCVECTRRVNEGQMLSRLLYRSRPLYLAPKALQMRVATVAAARTVSLSKNVPVGLDKYPSSISTWPSQALGRPALPWKALGAAAVLLIALGITIAASIIRNAGTTEYLETAVATHRGYLMGNLPLEIRSESPGAVVAWFAGKLPFHFQLPPLQVMANGKAAYHLTGARLVNYRGSYAALVSYGMNNNTVSLLVASSKYAMASGGDQVSSRGLTFHYCIRSGFNVVTWTTHGLTYALVSAQHGSAQESCLVCHHDMPNLSGAVPQ
jgi:anti-sigma factor RsiW